ncbi:MAG: methyltransferase, RsmE family [Clostridia bacterium]|nr:methyltransferase, RsmE family [Clostridia bacterium]
MNKIFFSPSEDLNKGDKIKITGEDFRHLQVLRIRAGEEIKISDNKNYCYSGTVSDFQKDSISILINEKNIFGYEPNIQVILFQSLLKGEKNEIVIQKAVELGASEIIFFHSENCVARLNDERQDNKIERFNKVAKMAAMQSGRDIIPTVKGILSFKEVISILKIQDLSMVFHEKSDSSLSLFLSDKINGCHSVAFAVGPEGGFSEEEILTFRGADIPALSLGKRILRAETAPLCALSVIMAFSGEL